METKWRKLLYILCAAAITLTACSSKEAAPEKADMSKPFVLRVGASDLLRFMNDYYGPLKERFPQMELDVVEAKEWVLNPSPGETFEEGLERQYRTLIEAEQPVDVLMYSNMNSYNLLIDKGFIEPLDARIKRDQYDTSAMYKPGIDAIRAYGGGEVYGLAPFFAPEYITFFNVDLFNQMGVDVPKDPYTWNDLIEIGGRFAGQTVGGEPISGFAYGCQFNSLGPLVYNIGLSQNLSLYNDKFEMTFQGQAWEGALEPLAQAIMNGSYRFPAANDKSDCLAALKNSAIVVALSDGVSALKQLPSTINYHIDVPPSSDYGTQYGSAVPQEMFSIVKGSPVADQAWEVIKAINDEQFVKELSALESVNQPLLPMREGIPYQYSGKPVDQFYAKKDSNPDIERIPFDEMEARGKLYGIIEEEFGKVKTEGRSLADTMAVIQQRGTEVWVAFKSTRSK
ncbi:ABC transporter substrate-binding protein [Paenibacillus xylaniclasticus]|uniref:ABC transporter substrate-binding protein n=1 Tax=Paenibacillus xylaniclasticus TaxID=588083 RepID=UPI0013E0D65B|nr:MULTISPECIES: extracellular solute-binding protein [Paenibacillus]GFN33315.1 hypothetical protein PCURB6_35750 [Paenibacillus curdlanolyticus]